MTDLAHQTISRRFLKKQPRVYDMSDCGTGKTYVEIMDFADRRKKKGKCALVLACKSLLRSAWDDDIKKFAPHLKTSIAYAVNREAAFAADAAIYITNHDAAKWLGEKPKAFFNRFDTLIVDEATALKHHTSQRSRAVAKIVKYFDYRRLLSGTPHTNGICDLWHQFFLLDDGKRLGKSFFAYRAALCTPEQVGASSNALRWTDKPNAEAIVSALVSDIVIRHRFEDCVDIPPNHQYSINVYLNKRHMAQYKELEAESLLELKNTKVTALNGAVLYGKLLQLLSGAVYNDAGAYSLIDSERYEMVLDLVEERPHTLVMFYWKHQRDQLVKLAEARGLTFAVIDGTVSQGERERIVSDFQKGFYRTAFLHPKSAAHGLTLTRGVATIWPSATPNLEWYLQGLKRIHRIGQKEKTETIMLVAPDTIEEQVYEALMGKNIKLSTLLDYLKKAA
jgi:SNF2 family DNA or RNA helicase